MNNEFWSISPNIHSWNADNFEAFRYMAFKNFVSTSCILHPFFFLFPTISSKCGCGLEKALYQSYFHFLNRKISETDLSRARSDAESSGDLVQNWHIHSSTRTEVDAGRHELKGDNRKKDDQESTHSEWSWRKSGIRNKFDTLKNKISKVFRKSDDTQW